MGDSMVVERKGQKFLQVMIRHGDYNALEERGDSYTLFLEESSFVVAVYDSVHLWPKIEFPKVFRPLAEIMQAVKLNVERESGSYEPKVSIPLCTSTIIRREYGRTTILVPVGTFVRGVVSCLVEHPILKLADWDPPFRDKLIRKWRSVLNTLDTPRKVPLKLVRRF
ncbi:MAG: hypothetical protein Q8R12_03175 [bacterium]|nr:hypothetical protein [bacterium]